MREIVAGTKIPAEMFHVSTLNVRYGKPFGNCEEDEALVHQLSQGNKVIGPFKARPEGDGYGVYVGRRRFLAKRASGVTDFTLGTDVLIEDVNDEEARSESLIENLRILRKEMNPVVRAEILNEIVSSSPDGLRGTARKLGIPSSTLSEWLKILELNPRVLVAVEKGLLSYTDALRLARANLHELQLDDLVKVLETDGPEACRRILDDGFIKRKKRGVAKGKYSILRITFDTADPADMDLWSELEKCCKSAGKKADEYCKVVLKKHVEQRVQRTG